MEKEEEKRGKGGGKINGELLSATFATGSYLAYLRYPHIPAVYTESFTFQTVSSILIFQCFPLV